METGEVERPQPFVERLLELRGERLLPVLVVAEDEIDGVELP